MMLGREVREKGIYKELQRHYLWRNGQDDATTE